jgi:hypothetical protein
MREAGRFAASAVLSPPPPLVSDTMVIFCSPVSGNDHESSGGHPRGFVEAAVGLVLGRPVSPPVKFECQTPWPTRNAHRLSITHVPSLSNDTASSLRAQCNFQFLLIGQAGKQAPSTPHRVYVHRHSHVIHTALVQK